jgi:hypothetical protein
MNLGHHPRLQSVNNQLPELMPLAYRTLQEVMSNGRAAATARIQAVKLLFDTLHISDVRNDEDPAPLQNFLQQNGVQVNAGATVNINLPIPQEYQQAFARLMGVTPQEEVIDANAEPVETQ